MKKEMIVDVENIERFDDYYKLLIKQLELPGNTGETLGGISDFMREPWEEDRNVRIINVSKTTDSVRNRINMTVTVFERVKAFQKMCGNEFTWSIED